MPLTNSTPAQLPSAHNACSSAGPSNQREDRYMAVLGVLLGKMCEVHTDIHGLSAIVKELQTTSTSAASNYAELQKTINGLCATVEELQTASTSAANNFAELKSSTNSNFAELKSSTNSNFTDVKSTLQAVRDQRAKIQIAVSAINNEMKIHDARAANRFYLLVVLCLVGWSPDGLVFKLIALWVGKMFSAVHMGLPPP